MIQFKKIIIHNFGSYGHTELDLQNRGFCLVSGQNNYVKDNALSNGSGKSFLWSAICFAMTGETISGIKTNLKNINTEDPDCFVQLDFVYNKDLFSLVRIITPKSDLKIYKNDIDVSGKGIRESEKKLQELLPELTKDLIASTIIIGQGMPNKFSSFSPSGRKELLEKLTKSDFMIDDLKTRITTRQQELATKVREFEDSLLAHKTQLNGMLTNLEQVKQNIAKQDDLNFDELIAAKGTIVEARQLELEKLEVAVKACETKIELLNTKLVKVSDEKAKVSNEELTAYTASYTVFISEKNRLEIEVSSLNTEIAKLQAIVDTCPTCGQHLPNVCKPDTSAQEAALIYATENLEKAKIKVSQCESQHKEYVAQINAAFSEEISSLNLALSEARSALNTAKTKYNTCNTTLETEKTAYNKLLYDKQNWDRFLQSQHSEVARLEAEISRLTNLVAITSLAKDDLDQRVGIVKKMDTLIRRDFRGYLLANIITYIDAKAKEYCNTVFGTKELSLALNGNALDITYCGKAFDGLSGGEKQRVDLILQLAIRDLLASYLGLSANILVLDEVTDFLDKKSCKAVMRLLEKELNTIESVFIISHHAEELELPVDSEIKVVKNELGISELY